MLCSKCNAELNPQTLECSVCEKDLQIQQETKLSSNSKLGGKPTSKLTSKLRVSKLYGRSAKQSWLPAFLAKSPLAKVKIHPILALFFATVIPFAAVLFYFFSIGSMCFGCLEVGGSYKAPIENNSQKASLEINFLQQGQYVVGNVLVKPVVAVGQPMTVDYSFSLDSIVLDKEKFSFQGVSDKDKSLWIKFNGRFENKVLMGKMSTNVPNLLNINNVPISAKKL